MHALLARAANPENPSEVGSRPSDALVARAKAESALNSLFLGLGAISLLVGTVGVANTMIVSVLERRSEIGLRRALGATRGHIRMQFSNEAILLSLIGSAIGILLGVLATVVYATLMNWLVVIPPVAWAGGRPRQHSSSAHSPGSSPPSARPTNGGTLDVMITIAVRSPGATSSRGSRL